MNFKPLNDRILVKSAPVKEKIGSLYIPDESKKESLEATVIKLGSGKRLENGKIAPFEVKIGDKVLINKYGATDIEVEGVKYKLLTEEEILAILE